MRTIPIGWPRAIKRKAGAGLAAVLFHIGWRSRLRSRPTGIAPEPSLLEHGPAGRAQAGLLSPQAGGDGANIRDFAGAESIDVGRAGPSLLRRPGCGQRGTGREQGERQSQIGAARHGPTSVKSRRHDSILSGCRRLRSAVVMRQIRQRLFAGCDFSHSWVRPKRSTLRARVQHVSNQASRVERIDKV